MWSLFANPVTYVDWYLLTSGNRQLHTLVTQTFRSTYITTFTARNTEFLKDLQENLAVTLLCVLAVLSIFSMTYRVENSVQA